MNWIVSIGANMSIDDILSIIKVPSDCQLVIYDNQQAQKIMDINSLTNVLLSDTYHVITLMDDCSYSIDHCLDSYSETMNSKMFQPDSVVDITLEATNKFFSSIKDMGSKCNNTSEDIINLLLSDPTKFYIVYGILSDHWNVDGDDWSNIYINAAKDGYTPILDKLELDEKPLSMNTYKEALKQAAGSGHKDIVIRMMNHISRIPVNDNKQIVYAYNDAMVAAAERGHIDIVRLMLKLGATDYDQAMVSAALRGHMDIVKLMLNPDPDNSNIGANNYCVAMDMAAGGGHIDIVQLMLHPDPDNSNLGANNYDRTMAFAAEGGHIDIVQLMLNPDPDNSNIGANNYIMAMLYAAKGGHIDIVRLLLKRNPDNSNTRENYYGMAMSFAAGAGHIDIVQLMLEHGAKNYDFAMKSAAGAGHIEIIDLIKQWQSTH